MGKGIGLLLIIGVWTLMISGCQTSTAPTKEQQPVEKEEPAKVEQPQQKAPVRDPEEPKGADNEKGGLTEGLAKVPEPIPEKISPELLYQVMLSEMARQSGQMDICLSSYLDAIKKTDDYRLAWRATQIALRAQNNIAALEAAERWLELNPSDKEAHRVVAVLHASLGNVDESIAHFAKMIDTFDDGSDRIINEIAAILVRDARNPVVLSVVQGLAQKYPQKAMLHLLVADIALRSGDYEVAHDAVELARQNGAEEQRSLVLKYRILWAAGKQVEATEGFSELVSRYPQSAELRQTYARFLLSQKVYDQAIEQFKEQQKIEPENHAQVFANAMALLEKEQLDAAEAFLESLLGKNYRQDEVYFFLGRIDEVQLEYESAIERFKKVAQGERLVESKMRVGGLYFDQGNYEDGMQWFAQVRSEHPKVSVRVYLVESEFLRERSQYQLAYDLLTEAAQETQGDVDVLYARAMVAERLGRVDLLETDLREVLAKDDSHAHALNALGYTLADKTDRYDEALALIEKAYELLPEDAAVIDSMGWINYRLGKLDEAEGYLRRAFEGKEDPEIAAHLGEVLWVKGQQEEALKIWQAALENNPENETLKKMLEKFKP